MSSFVAGPPTTFIVDGVTVSAPGTLAAGVANGVRVEVQGTMTAGVLIADKVHVELESTIEAEGAVKNVSTTAVTLDGVTFNVTSTTIYRDESSAAVAHFGLAAIAVNDTLQVKGYVDPSTGSVTATRIERQDGPVTATLSAPVTAIGASSLTMAGISVDISGLVNKATLLAVSIGTQVVVTGSVTGTTFVATTGAIDS